MIDTYLVDTAWVSRMSWKNETEATQIYTNTSTTGVTIIQGSEINDVFSLGAIHKGASVTIDHRAKIFTPTETTESRTITVNLSVPPRSRLAFYQKWYKFRDSVSFVLDAWGKEWNVGDWGGHDKLRKECEVVIMSDEYVTLQAELPVSGTGTIDVDTVDHAPGVDAIKKWPDCTQWCKDKLNAMYV